MQAGLSSFNLNKIFICRAGPLEWERAPNQVLLWDVPGISHLPSPFLTMRAKGLIVLMVPHRLAVNTAFGDSQLLFSVLSSFYMFFLIIHLFPLLCWGEFCPSQKRIYWIPGTLEYDFSGNQGLLKEVVKCSPRVAPKIQGDCALMKGGNLYMRVCTHTHYRRRRHMSMKAEIRTTLQFKEGQRLPANYQGGEGLEKVFPCSHQEESALPTSES